MASAAATRAHTQVKNPVIVIAARVKYFQYLLRFMRREIDFLKRLIRVVKLPRHVPFSTMVLFHAHSATLFAAKKSFISMQTPRD